MIYFYLIGSKQKIHSFTWKPSKIKTVTIVSASSKFNEKIKATTMKSLGEYMIKELLSKLK